MFVLNQILLMFLKILDSGATVHVTTTLQRLKDLWKPSEKESRQIVGNNIGVEVCYVETIVLMLKSTFEIVLNNAFYISSFKRKLVLLSLLDKVGFCFHFRNNNLDIIYDSNVVGNCYFFDGLYKFELASNTYALFVMLLNMCLKGLLLNRSHCYCGTCVWDISLEGDLRD